MLKIKKIWNQKDRRMRKPDYIILGIILLLYGILSFINLGSTTNPQTFYSFKQNESITIEFQEITDIIKLKFYNGEISGTYYLYTSLDNEEYTYIQDLKGNGAFAWNEEKIFHQAKYIKLLAKTENSQIGSVSCYNNSKSLAPIKEITSSVVSKENKTKYLYDEQEATPTEISYLNSTYFDEIYFARTAYEYANGLEAYEWVHPPLGKLIQAIPIKLSNTMAPFYYRLMGNIAGIIMIAVMYFMAKELFKTRKSAVLAALIMALDSFHFAHTRMGTVDSFLVLFIMVAFYFMIRYFNQPNTHKNLFFCGLFFGLATAVKWTGLFAGLGLAILFFFYVFTKKKWSMKLFLKCCLFFIVIPTTIYLGSYLLFPKVQVTKTNSIPAIISQTEQMYNYHSKLQDTHPFSSPWYSWPINYKPVWYYNKTVDSSNHGTITGIGNITIWWMGIIGVLYLIIDYIKKRNFTSLILIVAILTMWLLYLFIGRVMFLYHYFPVLPFVMLGIVALFQKVEEKTKKNWIIPLYIIIIAGTFILYLPSISGKVTSNQYLEQLKLFDSWFF